MNKGVVHYICFYVEDENKDILRSYPSAWSKIDYIVECIKKNNYTVNLISVASIKKNGCYRKKNFDIDKNEIHHYFTSFNSNINFLNKLNILLIWIQLIIYLIKNVKKEDKVLVYHSLYYYRPLKLVNKFLGVKFYLQIEDVFSSLNDYNKRFEKKEWKYFELAKGYLCVNKIIEKKLVNNKTKIISHGSYKVQPVYDIKDKKNKKIKLVYAGIIEDERKAAFIAIETMKYLSSNYELNILGFGNDIDINKMKEKIMITNDELGREAIFFHGIMSGVKYYKFLQSCDIALSTHVYDDNNMDSADHTFPSKVLVYLGKGLRVVAQRLRCLEDSLIGNELIFYDMPNGNSIADAIKSINLKDENNGRELVKNLNNKFIYEINSLLE